MYDLAFIVSFDHHIGEKTEAICDRIWVIVPGCDHILSLNNMIASIQRALKTKMLISENDVSNSDPPSSHCSRRTR